MKRRLNFSENSFKLSFNEVIDCVPRINGRHRITLDAYSYISEKGLTLDSFYLGGHPKPDGCRRSANQPRLNITDYRLSWPGDPENLKRTLVLMGPVSVNIIVTDDFLFYKSGVFYDPNCRQGFSKTPFEWLTKNAYLSIQNSLHPVFDIFDFFSRQIIHSVTVGWYCFLEPQNLAVFYSQ